MSRRRDSPGGPIWLIVSMYRKDPMVFYLFVTGLLLFMLALGFVSLTMQL